MAEPAVPAAAEGAFLGGFGALFRHNDILFAVGIVAIISVLLFPVPKALLDLLLSISITFSLIILLNVLFISRSLDFNSFPTILLVATMLRLALNIASTRLVLTDGHTGTAAAGHIIEAFGRFVMSGNLVIGIIIFAILTIINFIVITKGSGRIAEVSARFSLDAMPGKQMAIDADLSAGLIDEETAKKRRKELEDESTFFGAMDGASKFVRGDAIAGLLITFINLIGGVIIGAVSHNLSFNEALQTYTLLTIGDGLVSQVPALIVSVAAGLLVTKAGVSGSADKAVFSQLGKFPQTMAVASGILGVMGLLPGLPMLPFFGLSALTGVAAWNMRKELEKKEVIEQTEIKKAQAAADKPKVSTHEEITEESLKIDYLRLELGYGLLPLINYQRGHKLTDQIQALRKQLAKDLGFIMPPVRIQDNMQLQANNYLVKVKDVECAKGDIRPDMLMVMDPRSGRIDLPGEHTTEPTFGLPAMWVPESYREEALFKNYTVVDPPTVITTHLTEVIKDNIADLLSYSETQKLLDKLGEEHKKLVADTIPSVISVSGVQRVLQNLLRETVSVRDLPTIIEAIAEAGRGTQSLTHITEHVRARLSRQISYSHLADDGNMHLVTLSPEWEQTFVESLNGNGEDRQLSMPPSKLQSFVSRVREIFDQHSMRGESPILLTSPIIRPYVRALIERFRPMTVVLSQTEIHPKIKLKTLGQI